MNFSKMDKFFIIILIVLGILSIYFYFNPESGAFLSFSSWKIDQFSLNFTLLIVFVVCFIGNILPIPTPYTFIIIPASLTFREFFWLVGLIASIGALLGEIISFWVGRGTKEILKRNKLNIERIEQWKQLMNERPNFVMFLIFLFGLTPLNDDNVLIPLGLAGFPFKKTVFACYLGKLGMMMVFAIGSLLGIELIYSLMHYSRFELLNYLPGALGQGSWLEGMIVFITIILIVWAMMKIDVSRFLKEKYGVQKLEE